MEKKLLRNQGDITNLKKNVKICFAIKLKTQVKNLIEVD